MRTQTKEVEIMIRINPETTAPYLCCDICDQNITESGDAAVVIRSGEESILYAHKGKCLDQAEEKLGGKANTGWQELRHHMVVLMLSVGMKPADAEEALKDHRIMSGVI